MRTVAKALLFCDLVDSTGLISRIGDARSAQLFESFDEMARSSLEAHHGREIDRTDGFFMLFERPVDAVAYAEALYDGLAALSTKFSEPLEVRVGIHFAEVILRENDEASVARGAKPVEVEGLAKSMTARIMALAGGTQTLVSGAAADPARRALIGIEHEHSLVWVRHGEFPLKGVDQPMLIWEVGRQGRAPLAPPVVPQPASAHPRANRARELEELLGSMFNTSELAMFIEDHIHAGERLIAELSPVKSTPAREWFREVCKALLRHRAVDNAFFAELARARPNWGRRDHAGVSSTCRTTARSPDQARAS
jgi:class 3 adenylate cyclase